MTLSVTIPDELQSRLARLVASTGRSFDDYINDALREHLDDLEDYYIAEQRLAGLKAGRSQAIPLEVVMKRYGLEN